MLSSRTAWLRGCRRVDGRRRPVCREPWAAKLVDVKLPALNDGIATYYG